MMKSGSRWVVVLLLFWGAFGLSSPSVAQSQSKSKKPSVKRLKGQLGTVRRQQQTLRKQLRQTRVKQTWTKRDIATVDQRLDRLRSAVEDTRRELGRAQGRQQAISQDLKVAEKRLVGLKEQVRRRLRAIYMQGRPSVIQAFAGTRSVGDVATRASAMESVAAADRQLFEEYEATVARVRKRKAEQDAAVRLVRALRGRQAARQGQLAQAREDKRQYLVGLRRKEDAIETALREYEADERSISASISAYSRRVRRRDPGFVAVRPSAGGFIRPVAAGMTSGFGVRFHPIFRRMRMHTGVDFGASTGTPIRAAKDGVIISTRYGRGYGNMVIVDHGGGITTVYAHCSAVYVSSGQRVRRGQTIAAVGSTGNSTGPHLHFEVRVNGRPVNPLGRL